jgi:aminopeptidase YwaD
MKGTLMSSRHVMILTILFTVTLFANPQSDMQLLAKHSKGHYATNQPVYNVKTIAVSDIVSTLVAKVSKDSLQKRLEYLEKQGSRTPGNAAFNTVKTWISSALSTYGFKVTEQLVPNNNGSNIIAEKKGSLYPTRFVLVSCHYDSVKEGPGVNDNGTGIAALLEIARLLQATECDYSIILCFFTAEESGMIGSNAYVNSIGSSKDIKIVFNLDQVGGYPERQNSSIVCEYDDGNSVSDNDSKSRAYTDTLAMITKSYTTLNTILDKAWGTDYMSFEPKGYIITGYYEGGDNPHYHRSSDQLKNMDINYFTEVTKGAVAYTAKMAEYKGELIFVKFIDKLKTNKNSIYLTSNNILTYKNCNSGDVRVDLFDASGKVLFSYAPGVQSIGTYSVNLRSSATLSKGITFVRVFIDGKISNAQKLLVLK